MNTQRSNLTRIFQDFLRLMCTIFLCDESAGKNKFDTANAMLSRAMRVLVIVASVLTFSACGNSNCSLNESSPDDCANPDSNGEWQRIEYAGKRTTTMFNDGKWGEHFFYFPAFGRTSPDDGLDTDGDGTKEAHRSFERLVHFDDVSKRNASKWDNRTFSFDDIFDKDEVGVKTAGGYGWPTFFLPADNQGHLLEGQSGVVYDPKSRDGFNNIVNQIVNNNTDLHAFCLNLVTDNTPMPGRTNGQYNPNAIIARADNNQADSRVPETDLTFNGNPDVYTFKYTGFQKGDKIKIRIRADSSMKDGGGFGGIMVSNIQYCCTSSCDTDNECGGDDGCGSPCDCTKGEEFVTSLVPSVIDDLEDVENEQGYYIRGIYTRQVLTVDVDNSSLVMRPRNNTENQQWVFVGSCSSDTACEGYFVNKHSKQCLATDGSSSMTQVNEGSCLDEKFTWILKGEGEDKVTGGIAFEWSKGTPKFSLRHKQSQNNYLIAKATEKEAKDANDVVNKALMEHTTEEIDFEKLKEVAMWKEVGVENKDQPVMPWRYWVFEYQ